MPDKHQCEGVFFLIVHMVCLLCVGVCVYIRASVPVSGLYVCRMTYRPPARAFHMELRYKRMHLIPSTFYSILHAPGGLSGISLTV